MEEIDVLDRAILRCLFDNGRASIADIAAELGEPASTIRARLRRLESSGVITGYRPVLDPRKVGYPIQAVIQIRRDTRGLPESIVPPLEAIANVVQVTVPLGHVDGLVKVWAASIEELAEVIRAINNVPGIVRTESLVVLHEQEMLPPIF